MASQRHGIAAPAHSPAAARQHSNICSSRELCTTTTSGICTAYASAVAPTPEEPPLPFANSRLCTIGPFYPCSQSLLSVSALCLCCRSLISVSALCLCPVSALCFCSLSLLCLCSLSLRSVSSLGLCSWSLRSISALCPPPLLSTPCPCPRHRIHTHTSKQATSISKQEDEQQQPKLCVTKYKHRQPPMTCS